MILIYLKTPRGAKCQISTLGQNHSTSKGGGVVRWNDGDRSDWSLYCDEHRETVNDLTSNNMVRQLDLTTNQSDHGMIV